MGFHYLGQVSLICVLKLMDLFFVLFDLLSELSVQFGCDHLVHVVKQTKIDLLNT